MEFQQIDRSDPEKVYAAVKNSSAATISAGAAAFYDVTAADGISVSTATTKNKYLFAGIMKAAISSGSYGRAQVYGYCSAYAVLNASAVSAVAGTQLDAINSATHLKQFTVSDYFLSGALSGTSQGNPWNFVTLMDTIASSSGFQETAHSYGVFVRAL